MVVIFTYVISLCHY